MSGKQVRPIIAHHICVCKNKPHPKTHYDIAKEEQELPQWKESETQVTDVKMQHEIASDVFDKRTKLSRDKVALQEKEVGWCVV